MPASVTILQDLRFRLRTARLDTLALLRALDSVRGIMLPQRLVKALGELDADCAEALLALDRPPATLNVNAMLRDTQRSLSELPAARGALREVALQRGHTRIKEVEAQIRQRLDPAEAYNQVPGRDPRVPALQTPARRQTHAGRNDPCPCASGKKYKKCCGDAPKPESAPGTRFEFESGSYGLPDASLPSISCHKVSAAIRSLHYVLVKPDAGALARDAATKEAENDIHAAFAIAKGDAMVVAQRLRASGYKLVTDAQIAND